PRRLRSPRPPTRPGTPHRAGPARLSDRPPRAPRPSRARAAAQRPARALAVTLAEPARRGDGRHPTAPGHPRTPGQRRRDPPHRGREPRTGAALRAYQTVRPEPRDPAVHALLLNDRREPLQSRWPNKLVGEMVATEPLLATREPPVTADTIAHTGFWDTPTPA